MSRNMSVRFILVSCSQTMGQTFMQLHPFFGKDRVIKAQSDKVIKSFGLSTYFVFCLQIINLDVEAD